ncbi:mitochondrial carrier domain-containing protein [Infundibulicybe gibba]|nr:mitochondrial carrier domain-containing protein [Infundibulicybe gibba]
MPSQSKPAQLSPFGAALADSVVYPLDVAKTRIQALPSDAKGKRKDQLSMLAVLLRIYSKEGILGFTGDSEPHAQYIFHACVSNLSFTTPAFITLLAEYAYFFFYSFVRNSYINRLTKKLSPGSKLPPLSTAAELLLGALAGALAQIFTIPVSVIATRQQVGRPNRTTDPESPSAESRDDDSFLGEGVTGLWLGIKPGLVLTVNPAITYGVFERVKGLWLLANASSGGKMSPGISFVVGALSKTLATIVTYPYIMAKVRIQARSADAEDAIEEHTAPPAAHKYHHDKSKHIGALTILARVWKREGFVGWYQGMQAQIIKAVLSQALLFMSKEQFEHWALAIMVFSTRLSR